MQAHYPAQFEREMGCTEAELLGWLPGALRGRAHRLGQGEAEVPLGDTGRMTLHWQTLEPRRIALMCLPRLAVRFSFEQVDDAQRQAIMRYFDLYTQRGGG